MSDSILPELGGQWAFGAFCRVTYRWQMDDGGVSIVPWSVIVGAPWSVIMRLSG